MNYTINYPSTCSVGHSPVTVMNTQSQRTILLAPSHHTHQGQNNPVNDTNPQNPFPMVMQMGSTSSPVFYTYQNDAIQNKSNETCSSNSDISQVVLSPVSPVTTGLNVLKSNGRSPTINIHQASLTPAENKSATARSLGEIFNVQGVHSVPNIQNQQQLLQANTIGHCVPTQSSNAPPNPEIASLLSSLQSGAVVQVGTVGNDQKCDQSAMNNFIKSMQPGGMSVVENSTDNNFEGMYKVVDGRGNVTLFTSGTGIQASKCEQFSSGNAIGNSTLERYCKFFNGTLM